jgi:hypothetical protein
VRNIYDKADYDDDDEEHDCLLTVDWSLLAGLYASLMASFKNVEKEYCKE